MKYTPIEDRILVRVVRPTESEKTESGIILDTIRKTVKEGIVVEVGSGRYATETGVFMPTMLHKGDKIVFGDQTGMEIKVDGEDLLLMRECDVLLFVDEKTGL